MKNTMIPISNISNSRRAVALVIVLAMLVLMSGLLVAFMSTVSTERAAASAATSGFEARQAAESAVNLVISQIRDATKDVSGEMGWASQPGVIRTFDSNGLDGTVFKLYSSDEMQRSSLYEPGSLKESGFSGSDPKLTPEGYVNLNAPVFTPDPLGTKGEVIPHYPIADPRASLTIDGGTPSGPNKSIVEGFTCAQIPHPAGLLTLGGNPVLDLPMRVRWLYQLKDGKMAAANANGEITDASKENPVVSRVAFWTDDESSKINVNTASENTFWDTPMTSTPHESGDVDASATLKVDGNLNATVGGVLSLALAASQPSAEEYQRFPGHPATTSLSPALRWLAPSTLKNVEFKEAIYRLSPRYVGGQGSSMGATRNTGNDVDLPPKPNFRVPKRDRLFATLDEYWFRPDRSPINTDGFYNVFCTTSATPVTDTSMVDNTKVTPAALEKLRFFLTAVSRAPELNLYGKPRISIWPINEVDTKDPVLSKRSAYDELIAYCSTVAGKPYYFMRSQPWSPTYDFETAGIALGFGPRNKILIDDYLKELLKKPTPGTGSSFAAKYNQPLATSIGNTGLDQILLSIFDYVRSTNLVDTNRADTNNVANPYPLAYTPGYAQNRVYDGTVKPNLGSGQVIPTVRYKPSTDPTQPPTPVLKGYGRFVSLSEAALMFYIDEPDQNAPLASQLDGDDPIPSDIMYSTIQAERGKPLNYLPIRCVLLPEMMTVSPGYPALSEAYAYRVAETDQTGILPTPLTVGLPSGIPIPMKLASNLLSTADSNFIEVDASRITDGRFFMPSRGINNQFVYDAAASGVRGSRKGKAFAKNNPINARPNPAMPAMHPYRKYPFYSKRIFLPATKTGTTYTLPKEFVLNPVQPGTLTFEFFPLKVPLAQSPPTAPPASEFEPLQRISVTFAKVTLPVPNRGAAVQAAAPFQDRIRRKDSAALTGDDLLTPASNGRSWITANDVIRSYEANGLAKGDTRQTSGLTMVPPSYFGKSGAASAYDSKTTTQVHSLNNGWGRLYAGAAVGPLSLGAGTRADKVSDVPAFNGTSVSADNAFTGDFDRFMSKHVDGAFINKPDEGNTRFKLSDNPTGGGHLPYYRGAGGYEEVGETYFSPNRLVASPVMFGSLPSGIFSVRPWETLLFCPPVSPSHTGAKAPADHYLLDLFYMPVVEPYAISEPLSTAGKINLNSRLAPFGYAKFNGASYIDRATGIYAVLKGMKQLAIPKGTANAAHAEEPLKATGIYRASVDPQKTINLAINSRFDANNNNGYFKSATQICEVDLLLDTTGTDIAGTFNIPGPASRAAFWEANNMTGDNARERPYSYIYPRLTTKSNVYTVHVWAQSVSKNPSSKGQEWKTFNEDRDRVTGEYRGSTTIERYLAPNDPVIMPDQNEPKSGKNYDAALKGALGLDKYYRFRIINTKRFVAQ